MKKYLTLRNIIICCGAFLAVLAFCLSFAVTLLTKDGATPGTVHGVVWGVTKIVSGGHEAQPPFKVGPSVVLMVGYILMLVGGLGGILVALILKKPWAKWVILGCGVLVLAGGIMQFFFIESFADTMVRSGYKAAGFAPSEEQIKEDIEEVVSQMKKTDSSSAFSVVNGILGILAGLGFGVTAFLKEAK